MFTNGSYQEDPRVDNGKKAKRGCYKNNTKKKRMQEIMKKGNIDFMAFFYEIPEESIVQFSSCYLAEGLKYNIPDESFDDAFQLQIKPKEGIRHFKSNQVAPSKLPSCEKRTYYTESFFFTKDENSEWVAIPLLEDDGYLLKEKVATAFKKWAELANFEILGNLSIKQVSIKVDEKPPFTTLAWVQKSSAGVLTCLLDNGKMLCLASENIGCEDVVVAPMGYYRTKFNLLQNIGQGILQRIR